MATGSDGFAGAADRVRPVADADPGMPAELEEKTDRYEALLAEALAEATIVAPEGTPLRAGAEEYREMAESYLADGRHFRTEDDTVNALAAFSYGHAWLDAGARLGVFEVPTDGDLFTV
jgi:hypothetical protein